jgi:hypothetical protein
LKSNLPGFAATLLGLADGDRLAVKTLTRLADGSVASSDYDNGLEWWFKPFDAGADFDRMARSLRALAGAPRVILCMGSPILGLNLEAPHRRLWARPDPSENTMTATDRAWLAIDVDDGLVPPGLGAPGRYVEGAIHIRDAMLPEEFRGVTMIVSPSARTGLRGSSLLRCRMWFLLDREYALAVLKAWTRGLKAVAGVGDSSICTPGQPIYVGRPLFARMCDPISPQLWAAAVRDRKDRVALVANRYAPAVVEIDRKLGAVHLATGDDWRAFLDATVGGDLSFFEPLSKGLGLAARANEPDSVIVNFALSLIKQRADPARISKYDAGWLGRSLRRFRGMDNNASATREAALARLFRD